MNKINPLLIIAMMISLAFFIGFAESYFGLWVYGTVKIIEPNRIILFIEFALIIFVIPIFIYYIFIGLKYWVNRYKEIKKFHPSDDILKIMFGSD